MQIGTMVTATFNFILAALKQFKQPPARSSVKPPLHEDRDEFLEIRNRELDELKRDHFLETRVGQIQSECEFRLEKTIFWRDACESARNRDPRLCDPKRLSDRSILHNKGGVTMDADESSEKLAISTAY